MTTRSTTSTGGIGFAGAFFIAFLVLKLTEVIDWFWLWITAPLWIPAVVLVLVVVFCLWWLR